MTTFIALLRAINVGGTGVLPMSALVELCRKGGLSDVKTYIQSGNVIFRSDEGERDVKAVLEKALAKKLGKPVGVLVRTAAQLERVRAGNPFEQAPPNRVIVFFYDQALPRQAIAGIEGPAGEQLVLRGRELYIHYPAGQGRSKLKVPSADKGTARNMNTIGKLVAMAQATAAGKK